jgi:predicted transcriptional regulator
MDREKWPPKHHRSSVEITADILSLLRLGNTGKTQIIYSTYLKQDQATRYINSLMEAGLLEGAEEEMGLPGYRITRKGLTVLSLIESLREKLPSDGIEDILHRSRIVEINVGRVLVSKGVADLARENRKFAVFVEKSLERHRRGDWGDMSDEERQLNNRNLEINRRLFSSYESGGFPEIWLTTEPDRSSSTIMFPDEDISMEPREPYWSAEGIKSRQVKRTFEPN